jgi:hypothetical protein
MHVNFCGLERPDVDKIDGSFPVIAIEQKTTSKVRLPPKFYDFRVCCMLVALMRIATIMARKWFI